MLQAIQQTRFWSSAFVAVLVSLFAAQARAQPFPNRAVHLIVGVSPGGGTDFEARLLAQQLSKLWGQPVIVENRLGAAGAAADEFVAQAPADGYTLLVVSDDITALSAFRSGLPYDLLRDLTPVSLTATASEVLVVNPSLPVRSVSELIALAKSEPGKLTYGSAGVGSNIHLQTALFASMANINIVHVPYKGAMQGVVGVANGEVDMVFSNIVGEQGLSKAGKLRALAVSSPQRSPLFPSIPTISESGLPGYTFTTWYGVFAPRDLPKDLLATLNSAIAKAANSPEMQAALAKKGAQAQSDSPAQFAKFVRGELDELVRIVKLDQLKSK